MERKLTRICTRLFSDNLDYLTKMAEGVRDQKISRDFIIRNIIDNYVKQVKEEERKRRDAITTTIQAREQVEA